MMAKEREHVDLPDGCKSIRDQAAERGEPVPVGLTVDQLVERGYAVRPDCLGCAVLRESRSSPTGYEFVVHSEHVKRIANEAHKELGERLTLRVRELHDNVVGEEMVGYEPRLTVGWMRKTKFGHTRPYVPNWATIKSLAVDDQGFVVGVNLDTIPAVAPTAADFEEEDERRGAAGLPPLKSWQRPATQVKSWVRHGDSAVEITQEIVTVRTSVDVTEQDAPSGEQATTEGKDD